MEQVGNECFEAETLKCELKNSKFILDFCSPKSKINVRIMIRNNKRKIISKSFFSTFLIYIQSFLKLKLSLERKASDKSNIS